MVSAPICRQAGISVLSSRPDYDLILLFQIWARTIMGRFGGENRSTFMESNTFESMSIDGLSNLHEQLTSILVRKMEQEKARLEERLSRLNINPAISPDRPRRAYPKVLPKYQNPKNPAETWSGRGKQPHWVQAQLRAGKKLERFLIARSSTERRLRAA